MRAPSAMRLCTALVTVLLGMLLPLRALAQPAEFFFYSPEFAPGNLGMVTQAATSYFGKSALDVRFQPFARYEDFRAEVAKRRPAYVVAPHWIADDALGIRLTPLVQPVRGGERFDCKALMSGPAVQRISEIENGSVAATLPATPRPQASPALRKLRDEHPAVRVIPVPKDVDALLAVGFGQVDAAFVSIAQLEMLRRVNPNLTRQLHEIGYAQKIPYPRIYATEYATAEQAKQLEAAMLAASASTEGKRLTSVLGYDRWETVDRGEDVAAIVTDRCGPAEAATP